MEKFIIVSLSKDKKVLKESIDMHTLVTKSFNFKADVSSVCESMDVLTENGFRVIVEAETPFIHSKQALTEGRLSELYSKFKEKFGGSKDEFEEWYQERMAEKREAGTDTGGDEYVRERQVGGHSSSTPAPIKGVSGGTTVNTASRRLRTPVAPKESPEDIKAKADKVSKARKVLPATKGYIKKMFAQDPKMYRQLMSELIADYEATVGEQFKSLAAFESKNVK